jgi:hypothetical protein
VPSCGRTLNEVVQLRTFSSLSEKTLPAWLVAPVSRAVVSAKAAAPLAFRSNGTAGGSGKPAEYSRVAESGPTRAATTLERADWVPAGSVKARTR